KRPGGVMWRQRELFDAPVYYLAFHGKPGTVISLTGNIGAQLLLEAFEGYGRGGYRNLIYFAACSMLRGAPGERFARDFLKSTGAFPADNSDPVDGATREVATTDPGGTVFRLVEYQPGVAPRNHRTESLDYAMVVSGEIDMELDGSVVHLRAGDVLVQRGTIHNWVNRGTGPCVIAFVLVAAKPMENLRAVG